jgi:hypothetical protein
LLPGHRKHGIDGGAYAVFDQPVNYVRAFLPTPSHVATFLRGGFPPNSKQSGQLTGLATFSFHVVQ